MVASINTKLLFHIVFWIGLCTAFWGAYEMSWKAYTAQLITSPLWSGTFGYPVPHHYIIGFIILVVSYLVLTTEDFTRVAKAILKW